MANTREIMKRRKSIANISKLTKTMEMIASARFKKAHDQATRSREFTDKIVQLAATMAARFTHTDCALLQKNTIAKKVVMLVLTSNRGLCGGYNSHVLHLAHREISMLQRAGKEIELWVVGKKGAQHFDFLGMKPAKQYAQFDNEIKMPMIADLGNELSELYTSKQISAVYVVYMRFYSMAMFKAETEQLLPVSFSNSTAGSVGKDGEGLGEELASKAGSSGVSNAQLVAAVQAAGVQSSGSKAQWLAGLIGDYIFSPGPDELLPALIPVALQADLFQCFADAVVCEQTSRMRAMKAASDNAQQVMHDLASQYNRARQTQITGELLDIVGGSEALR